MIYIKWSEREGEQRIEEQKKNEEKNEICTEIISTKQNEIESNPSKKQFIHTPKINYYKFHTSLCCW